MSDHDLFLDAVRANPDDDAPRLIYADWLEEQTDEQSVARAELIRVQCQRAALPANDVAQFELAARERQLLRTPGQDWGGMFRGLLRDVVFRRGFVEQGACSSQTFLQCGQSLLSAAPLRRLTIRVEPGHLPALVASSALASLESLDLSFGALSAHELQAVWDAPRLHHLREFGIEFHEAPDETSFVGLSSWNGLRALRVAGPRLPGALADLSRAPWLPQLAELAVNLSEYDAADLAMLLGSSRLTGLKSLELSTPQLPPSRRFEEGRVTSELAAPFLDAVAATTPLTTLERLTLKRPNLPPASLRLLLEAPHLRGLRAINIAGDGRWRNQRSEGPAELVAAGHWTRLEVLCLARNSLQKADVWALADSRSLGRLTALDLSQNLLGDQGAQLLATAPLLGRLTQLNLSSNRIRGDGCAALADSHYMTGLRSLDLSDNPLGPAGATALFKSVGLPQLTLLRLERTGLNDRAVQSLSRGSSLAGLMTLDVGDNPALTPSHCAALSDHFGADVCVTL